MASLRARSRVRPGSHRKTRLESRGSARQFPASGAASERKGHDRVHTAVDAPRGARTNGTPVSSATAAGSPRNSSPLTWREAVSPVERCSWLTIHPGPQPLPRTRQRSRRSSNRPAATRSASSRAGPVKGRSAAA
jgi:hypothetical protein